MTPPRLDAMRVLKYAVSALDTERLLDQPAKDRVLTTAVAALERELDDALRQCPHCSEMRVLFPSPADGHRVCAECRDAHR